MPGAGFTSPTILFLSTWDGPERSFCRQLYGRLREKGYTRYVEPCSGAFAMPLIAAAAGWSPAAMEASDVSLFSSIVGTMLDPAGDFAQLEVRVDGQLVELGGDDPLDNAAHLLWVQLLTRMQARPDVPYWRVMVQDLVDRADGHRAAIRRQLAEMAARLGGLSYRPWDVWDHIEAVADDPHTLISLNAPTYAGGFERFFDTKGRLTWAEPAYDIFDPATGHPRLHELMADKPALLVSQQQTEPGHAATMWPVFARHLSLGQNVYLNSNRPEEVFALTGGPQVGLRKSADLTPADLPMLPLDHQVTASSTIQLVPVKAQVADYYRQLWMHRLVATPGSGNVLVVLDGHAAGVMGYSPDPMVRPYPGVPKPDKWLMRFAFGAPHDTLRLTRLATMLCLNRSTAELVVTPATSIAFAASTGLLTVEYTRHPEAKGLRGLMKMVSRNDHPDGHRLVYAAPWSERTPAATLAEFLTKEEKWQSSRT
ncbi:MAG TPA: hypothetical protein VFV01_48035 [Spirillospora sp.]|nr:hypothetical protein [Spirillospora sp.]